MGSGSECEEVSIPLRNLRQLHRHFRSEAGQLQELLGRSDVEARAILAHFAEDAPACGALASLHKLLVQISSFATHFKLALRKVRQQQQRSLPRKAKGRSISSFGLRDTAQHNC